MIESDRGSLTSAAVPPPAGSTDFFLSAWNETRDQGIRPRYLSTVAEVVEGRLDFLEGARLMGYLGELKPQQLLMSDVLDAPADEYAFEITRRATKTTTIFVKLLGRCARRAGYQVTFSAQSGVKGSQIFRAWANRLDRITPPTFEEAAPIWMRRQGPTKSQTQLALFGEELTPAPAKGRGFRILRGAGMTRIEFDNGSTFIVLKPDAEAYRSEAANVSWLDEAQEIPPLEGADLLAAILPLQDTKPGSSIILSGTAGEARAGIFWDALERGRAGEPGVGIVDFTAGNYSTPDAEAIDWALIEDEDSAMRLLEEIHPGLQSGLTTLDQMRKRWRKLPRPQWAREYLSIWPLTAGSRAVPLEWWERARVSQLPSRPRRVGFGLDIQPGGGTAALALAWRDSRGVAYIELVEHQLGTRWITAASKHASSAYSGTIAYDDIAEGRATAAELLMQRPRPRLQVQTYRDHAAGCVQLLRDLERGKLRHLEQAGLDSAVVVATKREVRGESRGVWLWGVGADGGDITPLVAATRALRNFDQHMAGKADKPAQILVAS